MSATSGAPGSALYITGNGFAPNTYGNVSFDTNRNSVYDVGEPVQPLTTSATGSFSTSLIVPSQLQTGVAYSILAAFPPGAPQAWATFTVAGSATSVPSITLSAASGVAGSAVTITGSGFAPNTYGNVWFDSNRNSVYDVGEPVQPLTTSATGAFSATLTVPSQLQTGVAYSILGAFPAGAPQASVTFTVAGSATSVPSITLSAASGAAGSAVTITGSGFAPNTYGNVWFDTNRNNVYDVGEPVQSLTTSATGTFSTSLTVASQLQTGVAYGILAAFPPGAPQAWGAFTAS